jgi:hypothetical protein
MMVRAGVGLALVAMTGCFGGDGDGAATVAGNLRFVQGGTSAGASPRLATEGSSSVLPGAEYIVSPRKARIKFTSVVFRDEMGKPLEASSQAGENGLPFTDCTVTYDRSMPSGSTLLDCAIDMPIGDVHQIAVYFDKSLEVLVSDPVAGIYSDPSAPTLFTTSAPAGGADFVPYTINIGNGTTRATPIVFTTPISITAEAPPRLFITTDMVQTFQMLVDGGGTITAHPGNDPVALFGGVSPGSSRFYSNANSIESYQVGSVNDFRALRIFFDDAGSPLFLMGPNTCGPDGPKGAWASPPIGGTINGFVGGWLGVDASNNLSWAQLGNTYPQHTAYYVMANVSTIGASTTLNCKATTSPPEPADGKTYASGAPALPSPDVSTTLTLLTK